MQGVNTPVMRWHRKGSASLTVDAYGSEAWWTEIPGPPPPSRCHDCGVGLGEFHVAGCDMERCPHDGSQAIQCDCERIESSGFPDLTDDAGMRP